MECLWWGVGAAILGAGHLAGTTSRVPSRPGSSGGQQSMQTMVLGISLNSVLQGMYEVWKRAGGR